MLSPQATKGSSRFFRDWTAWEEEEVTGIGPTTPDMPITNKHLDDIHSVNLPPQRILAPSAARSLRNEDSKHRPSFSHFMVSDFFSRLN